MPRLSEIRVNLKKNYKIEGTKFLPEIYNSIWRTRWPLLWIKSYNDVILFNSNSFTSDFLTNIQSYYSWDIWFSDDESIYHKLTIHDGGHDNPRIWMRARKAESAGSLLSILLKLYSKSVLHAWWYLDCDHSMWPWPWFSSVISEIDSVPQKTKYTIAKSWKSTNYYTRYAPFSNVGSKLTLVLTMPCDLDLYLLQSPH